MISGSRTYTGSTTNNYYGSNFDVILQGTGAGSSAYGYSSYAYGRQNTTGDIIGAYSEGRVDSAVSVDDVLGSSFWGVSTNASAVSDDVVGTRGGTIFSAGTSNDIAGVASYPYATGGSTTNAFGLWVTPNLSAMTLTNYYGAYLAENIGSSTPVNNYGLYIETPTKGSSFNYSIYSAGGTNYFAGKIGIGDFSPTSALTVGNGDLFQVNSSGTIAAATGITSSGTITFSGLSTGIVTNSSGVLGSSSPTCSGTNKLAWNGTVFTCTTDLVDDADANASNELQNLFSGFTDGTITASVDSQTDIFRFVAGTNLTLSVANDDATYGDSVTINATDTTDDTVSGSELDGVFSSTGMLVRTAANTYTSRTLTGTTNEITVTNGDGVSANPTLSLPDVVYLGTSGIIGRDANNLLDFSTDNQLSWRVGAADELRLTGSALYPVTDLGLDLGGSSNRFNSLYLSGATIYLGTSVDQGTLKYNTVTDSFEFDPDNDATSELTVNSSGLITTASVNSTSVVDRTLAFADLGEACGANQVPKYVGSAWTCAADDTSSVIAGNDIDVVGSTVSIESTIDYITAFNTIPAFNGGSGINAPFTVDSIGTVVGLNADLLDNIDSGSFLRSDAADTITGLLIYLTSPYFEASGGAVAPFTTLSSVKVTNLNADFLDGIDSSSSATGNTIASRDANGDTSVRYLNSTHVNISHSSTSRTTDTVFYSSTDNYIRKNNATSFKTSLGLGTTDSPTFAGASFGGVYVDGGGVSINDIKLTNLDVGTNDNFLVLENTELALAGDETGMRICGQGSCSTSVDLYTEPGTDYLNVRKVRSTDDTDPTMRVYGDGTPAEVTFIVAERMSLTGINPGIWLNSAKSIFLGQVSADIGGMWAASGYQMTWDTNGVYSTAIYNNIATARNVFVDSDGHLGYNPSSIRFKTNVQDINTISNKLYDLRPVSFEYKSNLGETQYGLIAEEVMQIMPEMVFYDAQGRPDGVSYQFLAPLLLNELQNQQVSIDSLTNQYGSLNSKVTTQQAQISKILTEIAQLSNSGTVSSEWVSGPSSLSTLKDLYAGGFYGGIGEFTLLKGHSLDIGAGAFTVATAGNVTVAGDMLIKGTLIAGDADGILTLNGGLELTRLLASVIEVDSLQATTISSGVGDFAVLTGLQGSLGNGQFTVNELGETTISGGVFLDGLIQSNNDTVLFASNIGGESGVLGVTGTIDADVLRAGQIEIERSVSGAESAGVSTISAGVQDMLVSTTSVNADSLVFVTLKSDMDSGNIYVSSQGDGFFVVRISNTQLSDLDFNWWVVN